MEEYSVEMTRLAERDLHGIYTYIADTLKEPQTARKVFLSIKHEVMTLSTLPERHQVVNESPYSELGVRKLLVHNYIVFYVSDREDRKVSVLRILYNRREWQQILGADTE